MNELSLMQKFADPELITGLSNAELMEGSLVTTVMGMGITFVVLALLWGMITLMTRFLHIKASEPKAAQTPKAAPAPAQPTSTVTSISAAGTDTNSELIAVITAAIAAMEAGSSSTGSFVVRKISRISGSSTSWSRAGSAEIIDSRKF